MTERLHFHFSLPCTGEGNGNPLQCSCLENPRHGGAWWADVYGVAQSRTRLKRLSSSSSSVCLLHRPIQAGDWVFLKIDGGWDLKERNITSGFKVRVPNIFAKVKKEFKENHSISLWTKRSRRIGTPPELSGRAMCSCVTQPTPACGGGRHRQHLDVSISRLTRKNCYVWKNCPI